MLPDPEKAARDLLAFYSEAGVDALLGEAPVDRFALPAETLSPHERGRTSEARRVGAETGSDPSPDRLGRSDPPFSKEGKATGSYAAPLPPDAAAMAAREAVKAATTLEELRAILDRFEGCALKTTAKQLVFADGNPAAKIMFVGEAPGRDEDIEGLPFVGRSGKLLDRMMAAIGLDRTSVYIANIIPWRPPGNRTPTPQESQICLPFIQRQIELADPEILVCLGGPSAQTLLGIKDGITKTRGRWFNYRKGEREIRAMPTFHPAFLLRSPLQKRLVWRDFLAIKKALQPGGM
jgi:uracil-DNA glycosylase family 4